MKKNYFLKTISFIFVGLVLSFSAFAEPKNPRDIVPPTYYDKLMKNGGVVIFSAETKPSYRLLPISSYSQNVKNSAIKNEKGNYPFLYESLYYINKKTLIKHSKSSKTNLTIDDVAKVVRSISKMEGMEYFSNSKNKYKVLYDEAYMISGPDSNKPIPDENIGNSDGQVSYCVLDDASFGKNKYKLSYHQNENEFFAEFTLLDSMGIWPITALEPGKMKIDLIVVDCGNSFLIYLGTDLDSINWPGIKGKIKNSMSARMEAVYNWFLTQF